MTMANFGEIPKMDHLGELLAETLNEKRNLTLKIISKPKNLFGSIYFRNKCFYIVRKLNFQNNV